MPTTLMSPSRTAGLPPQQEAARQRDGRVAGRLLRALNESCPAVLRHRSSAQVSHEHSKTLEAQHPEFLSADVRHVAVHWVVLLAAVAVFGLDLCLMSAVAEYLASMVFPGRPNLILAARIVAALAVGVIEIFVASMLQSAEEHVEEQGDSTRLWAWRLVALAWAGFITLCVYESQQAGGAGEDASTRYLMYGLAGFAFTMHCLLLLAHRQFHEAKGYGLYRCRMARFRRGYERARQDENAATHSATIGFQQYAPLVNRAGIPAGPFSVATRQVINEIFGPGTIPDPGRPLTSRDGGHDMGPQGNQLVPPEASPTNNGAGHAAEAETEYYRTILNRRRRDEESEVRP